MVENKKNSLIVVPLFLSIFVYVRLIFAEPESFSYDYINYLTYLLSIQDSEWGVLFELLPITFPYVFIPGGGLFEVGFVVLVKVLLFLVTPKVAYALLAAISVGVRTFLLRDFNLEWKWLILVQIYSITLFEANALRAGLALTFTLWALFFLRKSRYIGALLVAILAVTQHLQVLIFAIPFFIASIMPAGVLYNKIFIFVVVIVVGFFASMLDGLIEGAGVAKLDDYINQSSGAVGFNLISIISFIFMLVSFKYVVESKVRESKIWIASLYAGIPSLALLIFGVQLSALSDRAWQFALIVLMSLSAYMTNERRKKGVKSKLFTIIFLVLVVNVLLRYPLSNFFSPPLLYQKIKPLVVVE